MIQEWGTSTTTEKRKFNKEFNIMEFSWSEKQYRFGEGGIINRFFEFISWGYR